jgi:hypothetical protein
LGLWVPREIHHFFLISVCDDRRVVEVTELSGALAGAVDRLAEEFAGVFSRETVAQCVLDSRERLGEARIATYLPLLTYRFARERLLACGVASGRLPRDVPEVLFVCTRNAGRSQLAAALLERVAGGRLAVRSAGTIPSSAVQPAVVEALREIGINAREAYPKQCAGRRCGDHDGLRRRLPGIARPPLPRLGPARPGGRRP